jgi:trigger factor
MFPVEAIKSEGLRHEFKVTLPQKVINEKWTSRLNEIGKKAKLQGFRPGKAPLHIIKQFYGDSARAEVLEDLVENAVEDTLQNHKLRAAFRPEIRMISGDNDTDVQFGLEVEVLPEIKLGDFSGLKLERLTADVADEKITETINRFAKTMREPELVTDGRAAQKGDTLTIDFDGSVGGEKRPGMKGEGHRLELGSGSFVGTFEDQLTGAKAGDKKTVTVTFPEDYHAPDLAGKEAVFEVEVKEIRAPKAAEINDELAKEMGFESLEKLQERIRESLAEQYQGQSRNVMKRQLLDQLADAYSFDLPVKMVDAEFGVIWQQVEQAKRKGTLDADDKDKNDDELRAEYRRIAERRVRLGLVLAEVAQQNNLAVTPVELRNLITAEAGRFPGQEKAVFDYYTKNSQAMAKLRASLLENKAIDFVTSKSSVTDRKVSVEELMAAQDDEE